MVHFIFQFSLPGLLFIEYVTNMPSNRVFIKTDFREKVLPENGVIVLFDSSFRGQGEETVFGIFRLFSYSLFLRPMSLKFKTITMLGNFA